MAGDDLDAPEGDAAGDPILRPVWEDEPDETARHNPPPLPRRCDAAAATRPSGRTDDGLLAVLADAADACARLDARAEAAADPLRTGLVARLAWREAAGRLAAQHAWVHPHDLALRELGLAGRLDTALLTGRLRHAAPNTIRADRTSWADAGDLAAAASGEQAAARALALARLLRDLPRRHDALATPDAAAARLGIGAGELDRARFAGWRDRHLGAGPAGPARPALMRAAAAARDWMEAGILDAPDPGQALAVAAVLIARCGALRTIPLPFWAAWPAVGRDGEGGLPRLRPEVTRRIAGADNTSWEVGFLGLVAEAARAGLRELARLQAALAAGEALVARSKKGARLGEAVSLAMAEPVVTGRGMSRRLGISLQAANRLLAALARAGVVSEVTGRGSFRGFAV